MYISTHPLTGVREGPQVRGGGGDEDQGGAGQEEGGEEGRVKEPIGGTGAQATAATIIITAGRDDVAPSQGEG